MTSKFHEQLMIDDTKIIEIPIERMYYEEQETKKATKWSSRTEREKLTRLKSMVGKEGVRKEAIVFQPAKAVRGEYRLAIEDGKREQRIRGRGFGEEWEKTFNPPPLNVVARNLAAEEVEYLLRLHRLDDLNAKQEKNQLEVVDRDVRSPSPEPVYDNSGRRINTLEHRVKSSMAVERNNLVEECRKMEFGFLTPIDWKPLKKTRKIYLPELDNEDLNFAALLMGHRGSTQKVLEELSGCRISMKQRKVDSNVRKFDANEEPTHVLISADSEADLEKGVEMVQKLLSGNSLQQLANEEQKYVKTGYELIAVETVLRAYCENCREEDHKIWNCPYLQKGLLTKREEPAKDPFSLGNLLRCQKCGMKNHLTRECRANLESQTQDRAMRDLEFSKFLKDIGAANTQVISIKDASRNALGNVGFITEPELPGKNKMITRG